jgi:hypothetical protein
MSNRCYDTGNTIVWHVGLGVPQLVSNHPLLLSSQRIVNVMKSMNMILWCVEWSFYVVVIVLCYSVFVFCFRKSDQAGVV